MRTAAAINNKKKEAFETGGARCDCGGRGIFGDGRQERVTKAASIASTSFEDAAYVTRTVNPERHWRRKQRRRQQPFSSIMATTSSTNSNHLRALMRTCVRKTNPPHSRSQKLLSFVLINNPHKSGQATAKGLLFVDVVVSYTGPLAGRCCYKG